MYHHCLYGRLLDFLYYPLLCFPKITFQHQLLSPCCGLSLIDVASKGEGHQRRG